jgi:DNA-directed RNA polymerase subunit RPC12/RpoP
MIGGICIYCGKILSDVSKDICTECEKIIIKPKVKNGKIILDKNNKDHQYIMEEKL